MKLFYYKDEVGNFGDDLNPWLWDRLLPEFFDEDGRELLVGIGTLLNHKLPQEGIKHVFGSGYGYGAIPRIDKSYNFLCVRGPKTAEVLNIDRRLALTDPAILIRTVDHPGLHPTREKFRFGFIPHYLSTRYFSWSDVCSTLGFKFISAEWPVERVLSAMASCDVLICEAMHGAIVADALRIPWIPVQCYNHISNFKWEDWLMTVGLPYSPTTITSLYDVERRMPLVRKGKNIIKRYLPEMQFLHISWDEPSPANSPAHHIHVATTELERASANQPFLSSDYDCNRLTERYLEILEEVKKLKK